jgi:hypothetical protein
MLGKRKTASRSPAEQDPASPSDDEKNKDSGNGYTSRLHPCTSPSRTFYCVFTMFHPDGPKTGVEGDQSEESNESAGESESEDEDKFTLLEAASKMAVMVMKQEMLSVRKEMVNTIKEEVQKALGEIFAEAVRPLSKGRPPKHAKAPPKPHDRPDSGLLQYDTEIKFLRGLMKGQARPPSEPASAACPHPHPNQYPVQYAQAPQGYQLHPQVMQHPYVYRYHH